MTQTPEQKSSHKISLSLKKAFKKTFWTVKTEVYFPLIPNLKHLENSVLQICSEINVIDERKEKELALFQV